MSLNTPFSPHLYAQLQEISDTAQVFSGVVVLETNRRAVVRFPDATNARLFARNMQRIGDYICDIERGLKTSAHYAQIPLNG